MHGCAFDVLVCVLAADYASDIRQLNQDQAFEYGKKLQEDSSSSLDRSLASIADSQQVGHLCV